MKDNELQYDKRLSLSPDNVFRYMSEEPIEIPAEASVPFQLIPAVARPQNVKEENGTESSS